MNRKGDLNQTIMLSIPIFKPFCFVMIGITVVVSGCASFFDTTLNTELTRKVDKRLESLNEVNLTKISDRPPQHIETAIKDAKQNRTQLNLKPVPDILKKPSKVIAVNSHELSIAKARALALENNLDLKIAVIEPNIAATYVGEEEAKFDDLIFGNVKYSSKNTPLIDGDVVSFKAIDPDSSLNQDIAKLNLLPQDTEQLDLNAGIMIPLKTGGTITLSSPLSYKQTDKFVPSEQYLGALQFSISQPLFRNAGINNNIAGIRIARYDQKIIDLKTRLQTIRVLASVDKSYWELYQAWGELEVRKQQYELAQQNLVMVKRRVSEGLTAAIEVNRAEIGVAERLEALVVAKTKLKLNQRKLKLLLNDERLGLDSSNFLTTVTAPTLVKFDFDRLKLADNALNGRLELLQLELKLVADQVKIDYLENQTLPLFMLEYSYGTQSRDDSYESAYLDSFNNQYENWSVGLKVEIPLTNQLRKSRLSRAVQQRLQRLATRELQILTVKKEIFDALDYVDQNWQRIVVNRQNVVLAGANYQAELKQFNEGLRTMTEVLETLTKLGDAQVKEVKAITAYQVALVDLAYATGTLLGYSRVDV